MKNILEEKITKQITSDIFLGRMRLANDNFRNTLAYNDTKYAFYYWLGFSIQPKSLLSIGFSSGMGLNCAVFLMGCNAVETFLAVDDCFPRLGKANVRDYYRKSMYIHNGDIYDEVFLQKVDANEWDLVFVDKEMTYDKYRECFNLLWQKLSLDGLLIIDNINEHEFLHESYSDFCRAKNRNPMIIGTKYGIGMVRK